MTEGMGPRFTVGRCLTIREWDFLRSAPPSILPYAKGRVAEERGFDYSVARVLRDGYGWSL